MAFLILDIETVPRPSIDVAVEEAVSKKVNSYIERTGDNPENAESLIRIGISRTSEDFPAKVILISWGFSVTGIIIIQSVWILPVTPSEFLFQGCEVTGDTVAKAYEEGNIPAVEEYVMRDVEATHHLFIKIEQYIM